MRSCTFILFLLSACEGGKSTPTPAPPAGAELDLGTLAIRGALAWDPDSEQYAGYRLAASSAGIYVVAPVGADEQSHLYRVDWADAQTADYVEAVADLDITSTYYGQDKLAVGDGLIAVPDAAADVDEILGAGIGYVLEESAVMSGAISAQLTATEVRGGLLTGYATVGLPVDLDGDGLDDLLGTATLAGLAGETYPGQIAFFSGVAQGDHREWADADFTIDVCEDASYGPVEQTVSGGVLWIACPSSNYRSGTLEGWTLPLSARGADMTIEAVDGWTVSAASDGGVWAGSRRARGGGGQLVHVTADGVETRWTPGEVGFGAAPVELVLSSDERLLLVGLQGSSGEASALYVCEIPAETSALDLSTCAVMAPSEGVSCVGAQQTAYQDGSQVLIASAGWEYGSGVGCGVQIATLDLVE